MALFPFSLLILFLPFLTPTSVQPKPLSTSSPYLFSTTLFPDYRKMVTTFRIFIYNPPKPFTFANPSLSLFQTSLLSSPFVTQNPNEAHLFFIPFSPDLSTRFISRLIKELRINHPYWNRTLGADHFFVSPNGIDFLSDRNVVELKKNSVQISVFPITSGKFIPHKDITLPPQNPSLLVLPHAPVNKTYTFLGYMKWDGKTESILVNELKGDVDFLIKSEPFDHREGLENSKFCLLEYGGDMSWMAEAMACGCVPVVITDRPIHDLPLIDILRWSEMAVFVGAGGGVKELKKVLSGISEEQYEQMRGFGATASQHLVWNDSPQPHDAFYLVMYELWLRRHTIRYARREWV